MHRPNSRDSLIFLSPALLERGPTEPPAVGWARRWGDTTRVSSVSAKRCRLRTEGWVRGQGCPGTRRQVPRAGRPHTPCRPPQHRAAHSGIPSPAGRAPAPRAARGGRIFLNFNTKGILGGRKCITRKGNRGREEGDASLPLDTPRPSGALGCRDDTLRVPQTPQQPGESKQGAPFPAVVRGGRSRLPPSARASRRRGPGCPGRGSLTCSLPPLLSFRVHWHLG